MSILTVFATVLSLLIMAVPGFLLQKAKFLPHKAETSLCNLVLYGLQPFLLFMCFQNKNIVYSTDILINMLIIIGLCSLVTIIMATIVLVCVRGNKYLAKKRCVKYASVFSNCGFMGIPFLQMLFPESQVAGEIMVYAAATLIYFNLFNWTLGVFLCSGDIREASLKKFILNPVILSLILGVISFLLCKGRLLSVIDEDSSLYGIVEKVLDSFSYLSNAVTPLSMTVIGMKLAKVKVKKLFTDKWAYLTCFLKLIIMSLISILVVAFLPVSNLVKYTIFFLLSMPSAASTALFAVRYNGDADFGSVIVSLTTLLSVFTIPLMFWVINGVFNIPLGI